MTAAPRVPFLAAATLAVGLALAGCSSAATGGGSLTPDDGAGATADATTAEPGEPTAYEGALAAIGLAENETGGLAFEIDDADGGAWEVHVALDGDDLELVVSADGTTVTSNRVDGTVDADDQAALDDAGVSLADAVRAAVDAYGGDAPIDDGGISDDSGAAAWQIGFTDGTEVTLSLDDASVVALER